MMARMSGGIPKDEIEITPKMIQMGLAVLWASGLVEVEDQAHGWVVRQILEAALACHLSGKDTPPSPVGKRSVKRRDSPKLVKAAKNMGK